MNDEIALNGGGGWRAVDRADGQPGAFHKSPTFVHLHAVTYVVERPGNVCYCGFQDLNLSYLTLLVSYNCKGGK